MTPADTVMQIVDLRQTSSRSLDPLFEEEQRRWLEELHWDYRPSLDMIRKYIDAKSLCGYAALENGSPAGYGFYVLEETKGLIGDLFVSQRFPQLAVSQRLLAEMMMTLQATPQLARIEAQLIPFGTELDGALRELRFRLFTRQFMILPLSRAGLSAGKRPNGAAPIPAGQRIEPWDDSHFEACAKLIHLAYANHVDSEINDQYRSEAGATRFLKNIILLPGCGEFLPSASFVVRPMASERLVAVVLTSTVSAGVGHTTQICILPGYQGHGLGTRLMEASIQALKSRRYHALSLTVTSENERAVRLYERLGFETVKKFAAAVWQA